MSRDKYHIRILYFVNRSFIGTQIVESILFCICNLPTTINTIIKIITMKNLLMIILCALIALVLSCSHGGYRYSVFEGVQPRTPCCRNKQLLNGVYLPGVLRYNTYHIELYSHYCFKNKIVAAYTDNNVNKTLVNKFISNFVDKTIKSSRYVKIPCILAPKDQSLVSGYFFLSTLLFLEIENFEIQSDNGYLTLDVCTYVRSGMQSKSKIEAALLQLTFVQPDKKEKIKVYHSFYN